MNPGFIRTELPGQKSNPPTGSFLINIAWLVVIDGYLKLRIFKIDPCEDSQKGGYPILNKYHRIQQRSVIMSLQINRCLRFNFWVIYVSGIIFLYGIY